MEQVRDAAPATAPTGAPTAPEPGPGTELWLVRHGQTDWNLLGKYQGHSDIPLNHTGEAQARALAEEIAGKSIAAVYSSDLGRALQTARAVTAERAFPVVTDVRLREVNLGEWEGLTVTEIRAEYPLEWERRERDPIDGRPPQGESVRDLAQRVYPAVDEIAARHPEGPVLVVAHGLTLATILCRTEERPLAEAFRLIPDNAVVTVVRWPHPANTTQGDAA